MNMQELTQQFGKKNIPDIHVGDTVRISFKITEGSKSRIQAYEGLVIAMKHGKTLDGTVKIRKISGGVGVERTFPIHSPLIVKFEKLKTSDPGRAKLYYVRELADKARRKKLTEKPASGVWEEPSGEKELAEIEAEQAREAEEKARQKAEEEAELEAKFEEARASHEEKAE